MASESTKQASEDGATIDSIIEALYESMSFLPDEEPNWPRLRKLFLPEAIVTIVPDESEGSDAQLQTMNVNSFIRHAKQNLEGVREKGYLEIEVSRRTERFKSIAQVFSTYEDRFTADDQQPIVRGINSIQLVHHAGRWWISSLMWATETESTPLPSRYLEV